MLFNTYKFLQKIIIIFQYLVFPLLYILRPFFSFLSKRADFEAKNRFNPSFKSIGKRADYCFHVSSEGELEQCLILIDDFLAKGKLVELVYTSPSVERKCRLLDETHQNLRSFRMPLLSFPFYSFRRWVSAKTLFMCRYDFFSEIMLYGAREDVSFYLLSATLKGKDNLGAVTKHFALGKFNLFDGIFCASLKDVERFKTLGVEGALEEYEFRLLQIHNRVSNSEGKLNEVQLIRPFIELLKSRGPQKNIILGSAWPNEMLVFKNAEFIEKIKSGEILVCIAPHTLGEAAIAEIVSSIEEITKDVGIHLIGDTELPSSPCIYINPTPGVLLESFKYFSHCFIGGGHGRSIHSVLEPYLAGGIVYTGPRIHRSTEFDFIETHSSDCVVVVNELETFYHLLTSYDREKELTKRARIVDTYKLRFLSLMDEFKC
ncbi:hypothetical protein A9Q84_15855 [Halobacteriovorax marinus]|uniref:3-deoxy-D-manno-octulosonic acid transferase n=1 Tax=Halobacteriovorax marinus TaxID=97084 RepID=A0A1Y5FAH3_9BACT|nr:hypothetical protein A9Q84_15855 [Halobacteriovorax marinus]